MATPIVNFNVVLVGENFPVQTVQTADFTYRGRQLREQLRIGPALQAGTRGLAVVILPERFQVAITEPDELEIQVEGVQEIVRVFRDYIGRRAATHLGHNAQLNFPGDYYEPVIGALVRRDRAAEFLGVAADPESAATFTSHDDARGVKQKTVITRPDDGRLVFDFNFDYNLVEGAVSIEDAAAGLLDSLRIVESVDQRVRKFVAEGVTL